MHTFTVNLAYPFSKPTTCLQFNLHLHLFEMTSKYVEHELHDYNILLNVYDSRMVFFLCEFTVCCRKSNNIELNEEEEKKNASAILSFDVPGNRPSNSETAQFTSIALHVHRNV